MNGCVQWPLVVFIHTNTSRYSDTYTFASNETSHRLPYGQRGISNVCIKTTSCFVLSCVFVLPCLLFSFGITRQKNWITRTLVHIIVLALQFFLSFESSVNIFNCVESFHCRKFEALSACFWCYCRLSISESLSMLSFCMHVIVCTIVAAIK